MFVLKHYDTPLMDFVITEDPLDGQQCHILKIYENQQQYMPIGLKITDEGMMSWLKTRVIPKNREFVDSFLAKNGLTHNNTKGILQICLGLSLNDCYWIVEDDFDGKYKDYNLYENDFVKALSLIAYTGYGSSRAKGFTSSPEFTTAGMLRKGWRRLNGKIYLYKGGTSGAANTGNEPYSEYLASQIADKMELNHVRYGLAMWKHNLCSTCELFNDIDHAYVPIYGFIEKPSLRSISEYLKKLGEEYHTAFVDMLVFDALIYNEDRHFGNFGLIVNNKTNKPCAFAPLFDHGLALFNYAMQEDLKNPEEYASTRLSAYGVSFENIVKEFITSDQKKKLRKLIGFKFNKHPSYDPPAYRKKAIEIMLQKRIHDLLEITN